MDTNVTNFFLKSGQNVERLVEENLHLGNKVNTNKLIKQGLGLSAVYSTCVDELNVFL